MNPPNNCQIYQSILSLVPGVLGFLGGFFTAIFAEPFRKRLYQPKLSVEFGKSQEFITRTPETRASQVYEAFYVRVRVINIKPRLAKGCRAYLVNIEQQNSNGEFIKTSYSESLQLSWASRGELAYEALDLPRDVPHYVDILSTRSTSKHFTPAIKPVPFRLVSLFKEKGVFRFTVMVAGDDVYPASIRVVFRWHGIWDQFHAEAG